MITPAFIYSVLSIIGVLFTVFLYFRNPQERLDKSQAVDKKDTESRAALLEQKMQSDKENTEKRFTEMSADLRASTAMAQNHIHTVDTKVDALIQSVNAMNLQLTNELTKLSTIINERIPSKN